VRLCLRRLGLAGVSCVASSLGASVALQSLFTTTIERATRAELGAALTRLAALIVSSEDGPVLSAPLPDPRYDTPFGGRYWQVELMETGQIARSRSLWDFVIDAPTADDEVHHQPGPEGRHLILRTRLLEIESEGSGKRYLVT